MKDPNKYFDTFRHIRTRDKGNITVALKVFSNKRDMFAGFAFCSPNEKNFCRKKGRTISSGRLKSKPMLVEILDGKTLVGSILDKLSKILLKSFGDSLEIPHWVEGLLEEKGWSSHILDP